MPRHVVEFESKAVDVVVAIITIGLCLFLGCLAFLVGLECSFLPDIVAGSFLFFLSIWWIIRVVRVMKSKERDG